ncbi:hypothetical protein RGU76_04595 [Bacillus pseudomycoides]|uniref:hypothetical protein n=1 Tax=Bacillus TaxID=1386 RepID=UPI002248ACB0|nr:MULTISPECIES: hypothetical protein [Bacillus]MCX2826563.1 hypothetical protein [Bacillus sp. DHT2]MDR4914410.1 hypothetical protein [Bacillus pseudomycoides]
MITTLENHQNLTLNETPIEIYPVSTQCGKSFVVSEEEAQSLLYRINHNGESFGSIHRYGKLILIDRIQLTRYEKRGYKSLQILKANDKYIFMCKADIFKETVAREPDTRNDSLRQDDRDIMAGSITKQLARQLLR